MSDDLDPLIARELADLDARNRRYQARLRNFPDCRDPMHPGCSFCSDEIIETEEL